MNWIALLQSRQSSPGCSAGGRECRNGTRDAGTVSCPGYVWENAVEGMNSLTSVRACRVVDCKVSLPLLVRAFLKYVFDILV